MIPRKAVYTELEPEPYQQYHGATATPYCEMYFNELVHVGLLVRQKQLELPLHEYCDTGATSRAENTDTISDMTFN